MSGLNDYLKENYSIYLEDGHWLLNFDTILQVIKDLEGEKEELKADRKYLRENNKELRRRIRVLEETVSNYSWGRYGVTKNEENPEDDSDVGKQLFFVKANIKHYKADTNEYHFTNETEFVLARGWANAAERFIRNTCLHKSEEITEIQISEKPHIE